MSDSSLEGIFHKSTGIKPLSAAVIAEQLRNEENTKKAFITPILEQRWPGQDRIVMEYYVNDGRITVDEYGIAHRGKPKKIDYLLLFHQNIPLALVEAKGRDHSADEGYQQAVDYANLLSVPFAYATNGDDLIERDMISGLNRNLKMADFPGPDELWQRFVSENGMTPDMVDEYTYPYYTSPSNNITPRYYQRIIINKATQAVLRGQRKILIVCATGTGKTYMAFQLIWRFWKSGLKKRVLFLADRNNLVNQTMHGDFAPFEDNMVKFENSKPDYAHPIYLGIYQQFITAKDGQINRHYRKFPRDFFDLVVVDECHRSSADRTSNWHDILDYFDSATQIGLTATPKDDSDPKKSNIAYFGKPIYTYSLKQGIEDGFLAPYKVVVPELDIDWDGYLPPEGTTDVEGNPIEIRRYEQREFDRNIIVQERREIVAKRISEYLKTNDMRYSKTIVFCETIEHAHAMQRLLENENSDLVTEDSRYVTCIVSGEPDNEARLDEFTTNRCRYPVIAVTSQLMSTGVNSKTCELIVLDRTVGSMTEFKQIIGRGTRVVDHYTLDGEDRSKMYFTILDFRSNYLKFKDPSFDGDPVDILTVPPNVPIPKPPIKPTTPNVPPIPPGNRRVARVSGVDVEIVGEMVKYLDADGNLVEQNLNSCVCNNILGQYPTVESFRKAWLDNHAKVTFAQNLLLETDWAESFRIRYGYEVDPFDIILCIAYETDPPISREHRARLACVQRFIDQDRFDNGQRELLRLLVDAYAASGFESLRNLDIFTLPQFKEAGYTKLKAVKMLGGKSKYYELLGELENALYEEE